MKSQINLLKETGKVLFAIIFLLALTPGCSEFGTELLDDELNVNQLKSQVIHEGTIPLEGFTRFAFHKKVEAEFITDGYNNNFLQCQAKLTFEEGQSFTLTTTEIMDMGEGPFVYRIVTFNGKMSPSGQLKFNWPETWIEFGAPNTMNVVDQVSAHTGLNLSGPGVNNNTLCYNGNFNGETFFADMHLNGIQESNIPFGEIEGPVLVHFMIDLEVVD